MGYGITFNYSFGNPAYSEASKKVFEMMGTRGLNFDAKPSRFSEDRNAVRVFITKSNVESGYSPLTEGFLRLEEALDDIFE